MTEISQPASKQLLPRRDRIGRMVFDNASDFAILTTDLEGRVTSWNPGAEKLLGWSESEMVGQDCCIIFTPEDLADDACALEMKTARQQGRAEDERWHLRSDGSRFWASGLLMPLEEDDGQHIGYLKILRDRTDQHEANQRLLDMHRHSSEILESISDAFYAVDRYWRLTYINRKAEEWWGKDRKELLGQVYWDVFPEAVGSEPYHAQHKAMEKREPVHLETISPILGHWVEIDVHPTATGGLSVYFSNISDRRARDEKLQQSEAKLRLAMDAARVAMWELDLAAEKLVPTPELATFLGLSIEDLEDIEKVRSRYHPEDRDRIRQDGQDALARGDSRFETEFRYLHNSENIRWFMLRAEVIESPLGEPARALGALVDITSRKRVEEELRELKETLEEQVGRRTEELLRAEEALRQSQKMEAIGQLTGGVAHDFNNLLTIIRSSVDLLRRPNFAEEKKARYIEAISDTVDRAAKLTGQLLAFARRQALEPEVFDVAERTRRIGDMVNTVAGARIAVELHADCDTCFVEADAAQFETAIVNLAVNARDAMEGEGTLRIGVATREGLPEIRGHGAAQGSFVAISASDTGTGIPPDYLPHIFEPFFTTKDVGKGTGLGLSQVYGFAKQSGGDVMVESALGSGTTFTLYLPQVSPTRKAAAPSKTASSGGNVARRILVVEDNIQVGEFATQLLRELGHSTTLATSGLAALDILGEQAGDFDLVFTDVVMPGMSGVELAERIRREYPDLRVILTSGYSHVLAEQGTHGFDLLQKPYSIEGLTRIVQSAKP